ncbi:hypothetical protein Ancab_006597 [Ancistrocladus abbreviatus]
MCEDVGPKLSGSAMTSTEVQFERVSDAADPQKLVLEKVNSSSYQLPESGAETQALHGGDKHKLDSTSGIDSNSDDPVASAIVLDNVPVVPCILQDRTNEAAGMESFLAPTPHESSANGEEQKFPVAYYRVEMSEAGTKRSEICTSDLIANSFLVCESQSNGISDFVSEAVDSGTDTTKEGVKSELNILKLSIPFRRFQNSPSGCRVPVTRDFN